jgi:hypothetical protein
MCSMKAIRDYPIALFFYVPGNSATMKYCCVLWFKIKIFYILYYYYYYMGVQGVLKK